jgi:hypothetical protein
LRPYGQENSRSNRLDVYEVIEECIGVLCASLVELFERAGLFAINVQRISVKLTFRECVAKAAKTAIV